MKSKLLLLVISATVFASCSTIYKSGQTPDDVYFSPASTVEKTTRYQREDIKSSDYEEREIRMGAYDRRWRNINDDYDYDYSYNPYQYGYSYGYYYNPYYYPCPVYITGVAISNPKNTTPRMTSLGSYSNTTTTVSNGKFGTATRVNTLRAFNSNRTGSYNNSNDRTGNFVRRIITPQPTTTQTTTRNNDTRSYTPSNSSNSSSSGSSSSGSISRPARKN